jgi:hypothetical protein
MRSGGLLAVVDLGQATNATTAKARVLVAVSPAIHSSLDQTALAPQREVQLCQSPSYTVAVRLVHQPVSTVLLLGATSPGVDAVLLLKLWAELVNVDRLDVAADGVLHLDPIP